VVLPAYQELRRSDAVMKAATRTRNVDYGNISANPVYCRVYSADAIRLAENGRADLNGGFVRCRGSTAGRAEIARRSAEVINQKTSEERL
jgi:hypothetical protein